MTDIKPMSQVDAVFAVTLETLAENDIFFVEGETIVHDVVTAEIRASIRSKLAAMLLTGTVGYSKPEKLQDKKYLNTYVSGLVTNWFNLDARLNAGCRPEPKIPKSKTDNKIKNMLILQSGMSPDSDNFAIVTEAIEARLLELDDAKKAAKGSTLESVQEEMAG